MKQRGVVIFGLYLGLERIGGESKRVSLAPAKGRAGTVD